MKTQNCLQITMMHYAGPPVVGGVESVMRHHAELLTAVGHHVRLLVGRGEPWREDIAVEVLPEMDSLHPQVLALKERIDQGSVPPSFAVLSQEIEQQLQHRLRGTDVVIAHNLCTMAKNLALTAALRRIFAAADSPALLAWHHDLAWKAERYKEELHDGFPWSLLLEPWTETGVQHVAVSQMRRDELATLQQIPREAIAAVPSGVALEDFYQLDSTCASLISSLSLESHFPIFLLPVRITKRKNIELAIRTIAALRETFPQAALVVTGPPGGHNLGNSSYFADLVALRTSLALAPNQTHPESSAVHFLAETHPQRLSDTTIAGLFRFADALLMPSSEEGFGIPVIEAGLSGMPIFCSDIQPFREIAGDNAHFFPLSDSPDAIAALITAALQKDPRLALRCRVRQHYSWSAILREKILPLLRKATGAATTITEATESEEGHAPASATRKEVGK